MNPVTEFKVGICLLVLIFVGAFVFMPELKNFKVAEFAPQSEPNNKAVFSLIVTEGHKPKVFQYAKIPATSCDAFKLSLSSLIQISLHFLDDMEFHYTSAFKCQHFVSGLESKYEINRVTSLPTTAIFHEMMDHNAMWLMYPAEGLPLRGLDMATLGSDFQTTYQHVVLNSHLLHHPDIDYSGCVKKWGYSAANPLPSFLEDSYKECTHLFLSQIRERYENSRIMAGENLVTPNPKKNGMIWFATNDNKEKLQDYLRFVFPSLMSARTYHPDTPLFIVTSLDETEMAEDLQQALTRMKATAVKIPEEDFPDIDSASKNKAHVLAFNKLTVFNINHYLPEDKQLDRALYLDADVMIVGNMDPIWTFPPGFYQSIDACCGSGSLNSGVFLFKPSTETYNAMVDFAKDTNNACYFRGGSWLWTDQELIFCYWSSQHKNEYQILPPFFNRNYAPPSYIYSKENNYTKAIHFTYRAKRVLLENPGPYHDLYSKYRDQCFGKND